MYKKLDQFCEDHDKAIIKQVEQESRRLRKITPGAEVSVKFRWIQIVKRLKWLIMKK